MFHARLAGSHRPVIRVPMAVDHRLKRWQDAGVCNVLMAGDLLEEQRPPRSLHGLSGAECHGSLVLAFATFIALMMMGDHAQIEGLLGELSLATIARFT